MSIDGFHLRDTDAPAGYDPAVATRVFDFVEHARKRMGVPVDGICNVPEGRAIIAGNHTFGFDVTVPMAAIWAATGRHVWALGEHAWWVFPWLRRLATKCGTVDGTQDNTARLLEADELVLVLPGGLREAVKPTELRYRLLWGNRCGFVRAALRARAPIVPLACLGADDVFHLVGNPFARGQRWLGRNIPIPRPTWGLPIPHRPHLRFALGKAIRMPEGGDAEDDELVRKIRREVHGAIDELLDEMLAERAGFG